MVIEYMIRDFCAKAVKGPATANIHDDDDEPVVKLTDVVVKQAFASSLNAGSDKNVLLKSLMDMEVRACAWLTRRCSS